MRQDFWPKENIMNRRNLPTSTIAATAGVALVASEPRARCAEGTSAAGLEVLDIWHRQLLPRNSFHYPNFRLFARIDQFIAGNTALRYFATDIEFVSVKPSSRG
jgi:hypothetical protein